MKKLSLGVVAILLAGATVFANGSVAKIDSTRVKQECQGKCQRASKTGACKSSKGCTEMKTCGAKCN